MADDTVQCCRDLQRLKKQSAKQKGNSVYALLPVPPRIIDLDNSQ